MPCPGLIVVDEEHDSSYKQQDGFPYSARDVAVIRAQRENIPVVLGSATPSLESVQSAHYRELRHPHRAGSASTPTLKLLDIRAQILHGGISEPLLAPIAQRLERREPDPAFYIRGIISSAATASGMARANSAALRQARQKIALAPRLGAPSGRRRTFMLISITARYRTND